MIPPCLCQRVDRKEQREIRSLPLGFASNGKWFAPGAKCYNRDWRSKGGSTWSACSSISTACRRRS